MTITIIEPECYLCPTRIFILYKQIVARAFKTKSVNRNRCRIRFLRYRRRLTGRNIDRLGCIHHALLQQLSCHDQFHLDFISCMFAGRINISDLSVVIYGFIPLLFNFNRSILLLIVVEGTDFAIIANFIIPVLTIFRVPGLQVDLILIVAMRFQLHIDLFCVRNNLGIAVSHFLDDIVLVDLLIFTFNFTIWLAYEIFIADIEFGEFNCFTGLADYGCMIGVVSVLDLEGVFIHLIHTECEFFFQQIRWQFASILICKCFRDINILFYMCTVMTIMVIEMPFH